MRLPGANSAVVDINKLTGYCLDPDHPRGKHKARVFASALGLTVANADALRLALLEAAASSDARLSFADEFGERYVLEFSMRGPGGTATIVSSWIVRGGELFPRLTSCYVK
ncbi:MAG: hypothetical protein IT178_17795 [Acidobacteria bacterium]|nr:hypothetical protein [Acidobacteriota bacterium]